MMKTVAFFQYELTEGQYAAAREGDRNGNPLCTAMVDVSFGGKEERQVAAIREVLGWMGEAYKHVADIEVNDIHDISRIVENCISATGRWIDNPAVTQTEYTKKVVAATGYGLRSLNLGDLVIIDGEAFAVAQVGFIKIGRVTVDTATFGYPVLQLVA
jgi:hypothetical protein